MHGNRLLLLAASAAAAAAGPPPKACYVTIDDVTALTAEARLVEGPCFSPLYTAGMGSPFPITFRSYARDAALVVEATIPDDEGNTFADNVFFTSSFLFGYFGGSNADSKNLSAALTAPFTLRPVNPERPGPPTWVGSLALAPSVWPVGSSPPAPTDDNVVVRPIDEVVMASVPALLPAAPTEDDFRAAYQSLEELVSLTSLPGEWLINTTSPLTPSFNFFFTEAYNGTGRGWLIEAAAEVTYVPAGQRRK
jgi:hypothetical protein